MTTNANLLPGTLIEYKSAHSVEQAWVIAEPTTEGVVTQGMVKIRVKGETGVNTDLEFDIYVKAKGRAKILEVIPEAAEAELNRSSNKLRRELRAENRVAQDHTPRAVTSHADCTHEKSKAGRAACRKARAAAQPPAPKSTDDVLLEDRDSLYEGDEDMKYDAIAD